MNAAEFMQQLPAIALGAVAAIPTMYVLTLVFKRHWMSWFGVCLGLALVYLTLSSLQIDPAHPSAFAMAAMRWFSFVLLISSFIQFRRMRRGAQSREPQR